jgi:gamma-glutamylcysteine synthetase
LQRMDELKTPYFTFAMNQSLANSDYFRGLTLSDEKMVTFTEMVKKSDRDRTEIENADDVDFETFLERANNA